MMEKSSSSTSTSTSSSSTSFTYLKQLNKTSHKISKPIIRRTPPPLDHQQEHHQHQHQPPVYNINKSDFRQVVQKLTGSPAHDRFSTPPLPPPPPIHSPKPQSSRLQRIRPPPLAHLSTPRPPPLPPFQSNTFGNNGRLISPLSPLPPFPTVHGAAESPISAYMKYLRGSMFNPNLIPHQQSQQVVFPCPNSAMGSSQFLLPNSPLAFGRIPSPRSPYHLLSPSLLFSPTNAQLAFPQFHH